MTPSRIVHSPAKTRVIFGMLISCFVLWGLLNNMTDNLVPAFQRIFTMDQSKAGLVQVAFYGAYAVLAIFASILVEEFSYRIGVLIGLGIYVAGALLYIPACMHQSFDLYFTAIFIVAAGCSLLETTCNPYVLSLGDPKTAIRRLNFAQAFNPLGSLAGILLARTLILAHLNPATAAERAQMAPGTLKELINTELFWVCVPYVGLCALAVLIWMFFLTLNPFMSTFEEKKIGFRRVIIAGLCAVGPLTALYFLFPKMDKVVWILYGMIGPLAYVIGVSDYRKMLMVLLKVPRYWCGVVAQFFYVGVQIAVWTWLNLYCQRELGVKPDTAAVYYLLALLLFVGGRWLTTWLMKTRDPISILIVFSVGAVLCTLGTMYLPSTVLFTIGSLPMSANVICLLLISGCMSLMFPTIYGLALEGLPQSVFRLGAAGLIMAILGGALITPWMASVLGNTQSLWLKLVPMFDNTWNADLRTSSQALRASFIVPVICFIIVAAYGWFCRRVKKHEENQREHSIS